MNATVMIEEVIPEQHYGKRLDQSLALIFPQYSRARIQNWLKNGDILINHKSNKSRTKVLGGESVRLNIPVNDVDNSISEAKPEAIALNIIDEDEDILIINKPIGLVVHPGAGNRTGTLLNALLHYYPPIQQVPRAGIVHRLDKDTSGLMVVAKTLEAQTDLVRQLENRDIEREYEAIIVGLPVTGARWIDIIGRHPTQRTKMAILPETATHGKEAITRFSIEERFKIHSKVKVNLETGRTHQIRVHMAHNNFPLVGDPAYGGRLRLPKQSSEELKQFLTAFHHQALHARKLGLMHPTHKEWVQWQVESPEDMQKLEQLLRQHKIEHE
ncbi:MAG: 23S rRNA pseudouridine(1911/1915/1917) synthase RluD [Gammaproteobacteria bacterium]|nr:23S rRNA pseudouridine(1911/1915/1917) synthase RluD [Gammaproteobacteria bacterium]